MPPKVDTRKHTHSLTPLLLYYDIHTAFVLMDDYDRQILDQYGLNATQYRTLLHIEEDQGERLTTISDRLLLSKSTITRVIDELENRQWVQRLSDPEDRRAQRVIHTHSGTKKRQEIKEAHEKALADIFENFSKTEQKQLNDLLNNLSNRLESFIDNNDNGGS